MPDFLLRRGKLEPVGLMQKTIPISLPIHNTDSIHGNNLDFIRLFLAVLVIFSHSFPLGTGSEAFEPFNVLTRGQTTGGAIAVNLFFVISGFLITQSFERSRNVFSFLSKRVRRIYPGFIVLALLTALFLFHGYVSAFDWLVQTLRLEEFHHQPIFVSNPFPGTVNGSLWSISYEFWCYIGVALLGITGFLWRGRFLVGVFSLSLLISLLFRVYPWHPGGGILGVVFGYPPFWARLLPLYLVGVVFYRFRERIPLNIVGALLAVIALGISAVLPPLWTLTFPIAGCYLTMWLAFNPSIHFHKFARYGDFSYGTYLYAFPIQQMIMQAIGHPTKPLLLFAIAAPFTLLAGSISWHLIEKWFLPRRAKTGPVSAEALLVKA